MRMKKFMCCLLVLMLLAGMSACCAEVPEIEQATISGKGDSEAEVSGTDEQGTLPAEAEIEEFVLLDEKSVKITAKNIDYSGLFGPEIKVLIENNSSQNLTVQARGTSVNGYMVETMFSADVAAGKKANDAITLLDEDLKTCGISTIADIELAFHVFKTDNWETYLDSTPVILKTSAADSYTYSYDQEGTLVYDEKNIKIIFKELNEGGILGPELVMYIHNAGDKSVTVQTREVSIAGFMIDPLFSTEVCAGKHAISGVTFLSGDLEDNGIEELTDVELSFHIFDTDTWKTIDDTDTVTLLSS